MDVLNCNVSKYVKAMAHPFHAVCCPYGYNYLLEKITDDEYKRVFDATAKKGIAVEINVSGLRWKTADYIANDAPAMRMYRIAKECGCKFVFGSDSHNVGDHNNYIGCIETVTELLGMTEEDIAELAR